MIDYTALAAAIRTKRDGQPLRKLAACMGHGMSAATLSRIERGSVPDLENYAAVCLWLGVSLDTFVIPPVPGIADRLSALEARIEALEAEKEV